jgi:hypothetical protein
MNSLVVSEEASRENFSKDNNRLENGSRPWPSSPFSPVELCSKSLETLSTTPNYAETNARYKKHISCVNFISNGRKQQRNGESEPFSVPWQSEAEGRITS